MHTQMRLTTESLSDDTTGPAHAVYFATYEVVKQSMGGNASGHHPLAAGISLITSPSLCIID